MLYFICTYTRQKIFCEKKFIVRTRINPYRSLLREVQVLVCH